MCRDITITHPGCQHKIKSKEICEARRQEVKRVARSSCCVLWAPSERSVCKILPETQHSRRPCQVCQRHEAERRKNDRKMTEQARAQAREHAQRYAGENRDSVALMSEAFQVMPADEFNRYKQPRTREPAAQTSEPSSSFLTRPKLYEKHLDNNLNKPLPPRGRDRIMDTPAVTLDYLNNKKPPPRSFKASDVRKAAPPRLNLNKTLPQNPAPVPVPVPVPGAGRSLTENNTRTRQPQPTYQSRNQQAINNAEVSPLSPTYDGEPLPDDKFLAALEQESLDDLQRM
ncbi:hypothetical protein QBC46DRAFT_336594 [Diplogelasinospora grovesii]|uniref:Uncharacterized protein n=1 Tax=Diplogelasinospora grovesii TaxID=303347 RepID=A0AAN6NIA5_9PEZI|nr:hypothetical protein QBC46DRAFT_336594 [Diplogelasinospora grovesii]